MSHSEKTGDSKTQTGNIMTAVEDIQRMTPESIVQQFDEQLEQTQRHFEPHPMQDTCNAAATRLVRCLRLNERGSGMCFIEMEDYQRCVTLATQNYIDQLAEEEQQRRLDEQRLPIMPPRPIPSPTDAAVKRQRSWLKPWTWLR